MPTHGRRLDLTTTAGHCTSEQAAAHGRPRERPRGAPSSDIPTSSPISSTSSSATHTIHVSYTDAQWSFTYPSSTTYGQLRADLGGKVRQLLMAQYPIVFNERHRPAVDLQLTPNGPDLATLGRISGVGTELGAVAVAKRMGDSKHADGDHPFTIYAGLERTVEENVRLLKENEQLREQLSARQQAHDTATVETRNHNAELETTVRDLRQAKDKATRDLHATKEELSALHRDQDSAFDTIMSRLGVIVGQNECLKQKCEEVLKQNTVLQRQVQVLQKHHENLHRQYDKLCAGHEGVARDTAGLREQAEKIYKRQMHQETHALEPLLGRADAASDRLAVVVEQVMMVKEELECARREDADNEARGRWQDLAELGEETQRVARATMSEVAELRKTTKNLLEQDHVRRQDHIDLARVQEEIRQTLEQLKHMGDNQVPVASSRDIKDNAYYYANEHAHEHADGYRAAATNAPLHDRRTRSESNSVQQEHHQNRSSTPRRHTATSVAPADPRVRHASRSDDTHDVRAERQARRHAEESSIWAPVRQFYDE